MRKIFELATRWKALLLFDEADIFLEKRSLSDLGRNSLVSVLLRILEYFEGILFLTSNRVKTFDEAFQSRIHLAVRFQDLGDRQRTRIWSTWLEKYREEIEDTEGIKEELAEGEYSRAQLNGRQIRNVFSNAMALARNERSGTKMTYRHLERVLKQTTAFQQYMAQNQQAAEKEGIR
jgi:SpoVK/Ycf46/Vps4 family AAA+-type ATPase